MELTKRNISLTCKKGSAMTQLTLDDDFNVPDTKADIERIMKYQGQIEPESIRALDGKVVVRGKLAFRILYGGVGGENAIHNMKGSIPFEETARRRNTISWRDGGSFYQLDQFTENQCKSSCHSTY